MKIKNKRSLTIITTIFLLLLLCAGTALAIIPKPPQAPENISDIDELEAYFNDLVAYGDPAGFTFMVVKDGQAVYNNAFGLADGPAQIQATSDTIYRWWSTTKIFTAVAIFQLQEEGLLDIDDEVDEYLPFFSVRYRSDADRRITIKHLLNHSSGLPNNVPAVIGWMHLEDEPALDQTALLQKVLPDYSKLIFEPGTKSVYTNVGYMVLGAIIEKVSGEKYEDYVHNHILEPLKMKHTGFIYAQDMLSNAAAGMHPLFSIQSGLLPFCYGNRLPGFIREIEDGRIWFNRLNADSNPPTGLVGPATDLSRFVTAYLNGGELDGSRILSPASIDQMMRQDYISISGLQVDSTEQGLGWEICGKGENLCIEHSGGGPGFGSAIRLLPEESLGMVITANSTNIDSTTIFNLAKRMDW